MNQELPQFLRDMIASPPSAGNGLHKWLYRVARQLHAHRDEQTIVDLLTAASDGCGRHVPQSEIVAAVESARATAWQPSGTTGKVRTAPTPPKWPERDAWKVAQLPPFSLVNLWESSPITCTRDSTDAEFFADELFPGNPLLCVGYSAQVFETRPREDFRGKLWEQCLIVPSPMSALVGIRKSDGKLSSHTLSNTGPRHYLVTEFDQGTPDEQCSIIWHLREFAPLVMVLSSGGKSLHAWFDARGTSEEVQRRFFRYAVTLGADPATWTRSQFVRLPQGWRADKAAHQEVHYFNHELAAEGRKQ
jgi:hypothetical protein